MNIIGIFIGTKADNLKGLKIGCLVSGCKFERIPYLIK